MENRDTLQIAKNTFADIAARFPAIHMVQDNNTPGNIDISITLPVQPSLKQKVWLCFQNNDELHFSVEHFWLEWFPCTEPSCVQSYVDAVTGYLSGNYRVLEHYRGRNCVKAELQAPGCNGWQTIGTWSKFWFPIPSVKSLNEVRNT